MSIGIYKYQNKLNNKVYIGQSVNIENRYKQHLYDAINRPEETGIDLAIAKYGIENFDFQILEECPQDKLDEREIYWIDFYDSYNNGYNRTIGGSSLRGKNHPRALISEDTVWKIRELYGQKVKRSSVFSVFQNDEITERNFLKIWNGETWTDIHMDVYTPENKAWHKAQINCNKDQKGLSSLNRAIKQDEIDQWINDYNDGLTINAIAKKYKRDNGTVEKYIHNPNSIQKIQYRGRKLQNINTGKIFKSISSAAKWAGCGTTTLARHLASDKIAGKIPNTNEPAQWIELS